MTDRQTNKFNIVSLGFFCSVAMEIERIGLRDVSLPFDWVISEKFDDVIRLMQTEFKNFFNPKWFYQDPVHLNIYMNQKCGIKFFHDFVSWKSFDSQYESFCAKYERRIDRFYQVINSPTLFVRYCNGKEDIEYIVRYKEEIISFLHSYNQNNSILYITSENNIDNDDFIFVQRDDNDTVARNFLTKLPRLEEYLMASSGMSDVDIKNNLLFLQKKNRKEKLLRISNLIQRLIHGTYVHCQQ